MGLQKSYNVIKWVEYQVNIKCSLLTRGEVNFGLLKN